MMDRHSFVCGFAAVLAMTALSLAQEATAPPERRSLADGLVRQRIEIDGIRPPALTEGLELGHGEGPLVLLVRRSDGSLQPFALDRGLGDHGASPEPHELEAEPEQEVDVKPGAPAAPAQPAKAPGAPPKLASLRLKRAGEGAEATLSTDVGLTLRPRDGDASGTFDMAPLRPLLQRLLEAREGTPVAATLMLEASPETLVSDVVQTWELARSLGYTRLLLGGMSNGPLTDEQLDVLEAIPDRFGFAKEKAAAGFTVRQGELLVLLDGPTRWGDFVPLYVHCAQIGVWRVGLVGQHGKDRRFKLPINLPFDKGP